MSEEDLLERAAACVQAAQATQDVKMCVVLTWKILDRLDP